MTPPRPHALDTGAEPAARPRAAHAAAVLVAYRPRADLSPQLQALARQVGTVVLVDNAEQAQVGLARAAADSGVLRLDNGNRGGLAGAYNRALEHLRRHAPQTRQVVFVDDDSDVGALQRLLDHPDTRRLLDRPEVAAVSAAYRDRATGLRGKYMQLGRWRLHYLPREFEHAEPVAFVINSMSVWRMAALDRLGPFNEGLRVDHVDTEYCLRARAAGLQVWVNGACEFAHTIGERRRFRFLGREMQAGGHAPARRYLIGRNTAWLARRYLWREPAFALLCVLRLGYEAVGIVKAEPQRLAKLGALARGVFSGLLRPLR